MFVSEREIGVKRKRRKGCKFKKLGAVNKRDEVGWRIFRVICNRIMKARMKVKVYKMGLRPAMMYILKTVALTKI